MCNVHTSVMDNNVVKESLQGSEKLLNIVAKLLSWQDCSGGEGRVWSLNQEG